MALPLATVFTVTTTACPPEPMAGAVHVSEVVVGVPLTGQAAPPTVAVAVASKNEPVMVMEPPAWGR